MSIGRSIAAELTAEGHLGRLLTCSVDQLRPHPSLIRLRIVPSAEDFSAAIGQRDNTIKEPLTISQNYYILAGHARWNLAQREGEKTLPCLQLDMTEEEALLWLIQKHRRTSSINDFSRILLALELEPWLKARARSNQQVGGQLKGSSTLTKADKLDVRSEIASAASVSVGNVSKVKHLISVARSELLEALREGEVSIHRASVWLRDPDKQLDQLTLSRSLSGITRKIASLLRRHPLPSPRSDGQLELQRVEKALASLDPERRVSVLVSAIQIPGEVLLLSTGLLKALERQGELQP